MDNLAFDEISYLQDGKRITLISGDIHYFRIPREQWRDRLEKLKAHGANCVSTYIPWIIYEPEEDVFIDNNPQYDLEAYLDMCNDLGLWVVARPGPYQYSELNYAGLPGWIFSEHPEMAAQRLDGTSINAVSYLHPAFLDRAHKWFNFIIPKLTGHQVTNGGPVVMVQLDNELMGIHEWNGSRDYHPDAMGIGRNEGRWPDYLKSKYGTISAANEAYGMDRKEWSEILPVASVSSGSFEERRLIRDYQECYFRSVAEYTEILANWMREYGIDVTFIHNAANPHMNPYFNEMVSRLGNEHFLLGVDHYYNLNIDWDQNNPTPKYAVDVFRSLEMLRLRGYPPTVLEMQGGSLSDFPPITANDISCAYMVNAAYGMKGYNIYVFAGGPNPEKSGITSDMYDLGAGVAPDGTLRDMYYAQQKVASFFNDNDWIPNASRVSDCNIGLIWDYARSYYHCSDRKGGLLFSNLDALRFMNRGLLMTSFCSSLSPNILDLENGDLRSELGKPLMVASAITMPRNVQEKLVEFLDAGGKLLIAPVIPMFDEEFHPCTVLADYLGGCEQKQFESHAVRVNAFGINNIYIRGGLYESVFMPAGSIVTAEDEFSGKVLGWKKALDSGGIVSLIGLDWIQSHREHEQMLRLAVNELDLQPVVSCSNPNLWTSLRSDGTHNALFVMNLFTSPMATQLSYTDKTSGKNISIGETTIPGMSACVWADGIWIYP